jgi:DNA modification methylase
MIPTNQVVQGDCTQVLKLVPNDSIDFVLTDPPYGVRYKDRFGRTLANDDDISGILGAFPHLYRVLKPNSFCVCFYGWNKVDQFMGAWRAAGFRPCGHLVWTKDYASSRRFLASHHEQAYLLCKGQPAALENPISDVRPWKYTGNKAHPTQKAVAILKPLVQSFSSPGQIVMDPFCGSGSTLMAAASCGRRYIGIDVDAKYCAISTWRLERALAGTAAATPPAAATPRAVA